MTQEEKNELMERLGPQDYEAYMELRRQMDVLAADERMDDAQKAAFYAQIREELIVMRRQRDLLTRRLQAFNDLIDEVETRLKETEKYDRRKKKKLRLLPPPPTNAQIDYRERQEAHFAQGMTFYKLFWVFFIGCFAGVVLETIYCLIQRGHYESRVGLIYGPFNLVYGIGALCLAALSSARWWNTPVRGFRRSVSARPRGITATCPITSTAESACCIRFSGAFWASSGSRISIRAWRNGF